jgi:hypothetical protein
MHKVGKLLSASSLSLTLGRGPLPAANTKTGDRRRLRRYPKPWHFVGKKSEEKPITCIKL